MKIKRLHLENYGRFDELTVDFAPTAERKGNVTVIIGNNGAGKSQVLQALESQLARLVHNLNDGVEMHDLTYFHPRAEEGIGYSHLICLNQKINSSHVQVNLSLEEQKKIWSFCMGAENSGPNLAWYSRANWEKLFRTIQHRDNQPIIGFYSDVRFSNRLETNVSSQMEYKQRDAYRNCLNPVISFSSFVYWFKFREDIENEEKRKYFDDISEKLTTNAEDSTFLATQFAEIAKKKDIQLTACKTAITSFIPYFSNLHIDRKSTPFAMKLTKDGEELNLNQLSQGEKSLLALVGDIARRLAMLNPSLENPLEGEGVVMIDEVDLHLHPKWQHDLIDKLVTTFPNCQFILTTHSPHIISDRDDILVYALNDGELTQVPNVYGEDVNTLLTQVFDVDVRDSKVEAQFDEAYRAISQKDYGDAQAIIERLMEQLPSENMELFKCRLLLAEAQLQDKNEG